MPTLTPVNTMMAAAQQLTMVLQKVKPQENENYDALQQLGDLFTKIVQQGKKQQPVEQPQYVEKELTNACPPSWTPILTDNVTVVTSNRTKEDGPSRVEGAPVPKVDKAPVPRVVEIKGLIVVCPTDAVITLPPPTRKIETAMPNYVTDDKDKDKDEKPPPRYLMQSTTAQMLFLCMEVHKPQYSVQQLAT